MVEKALRAAFVCYRFRVRQHTSSGKKLVTRKGAAHAGGVHVQQAEITVNLEHCRWANCESVVLDIFIPYRVCCGSRSSDVAVDFLDEASSI